MIRPCIAFLVASIILLCGRSFSAAQLPNPVRPSTDQPKTYRPLTFQIPDKAVAAAFAPQGLLVIANSRGQILTLLTGDPVSIPQPLVETSASVNTLAVSPDGRLIATATTDGAIQLIDREHPADARKLSLPNPGTISHLQFAPDNSLIVAAPDQSLKSTDPPPRATKSSPPPDGVALYIWPPDAKPDDFQKFSLPEFVALSPTAAYAVVLTPDRGYVLWDVATHQPVHVFAADLSLRYDRATADISPNNELMALAGEHSLNLFKMSTGEKLACVPLETPLRQLFYSDQLAFYSIDEKLFGIDEAGWLVAVNTDRGAIDKLARLTPEAKPSCVFDPSTGLVAQIQADGSIEVVSIPTAHAPAKIAHNEIRGGPETEEPQSNENYVAVPVFYGTNRSHFEQLTWSQAWLAYFATAIGLGSVIIVVVVTMLAVLIKASLARRCLLAGTAIVLLLATVFAQAKSGDVVSKGMRYGVNRADLECGKCIVTVPRTHVVGNLEEPPEFWIFKAESDPAAHITLRSENVTPLSASQFTAAFRDQVAKSTDKDAFVFVHGYNVSFADAARRTAQLAVDLKFAGTPAFYSWPSQEDPLKYFQDRENADNAGPILAKFLTMLVTNTGVEHVHLIAHSMGNRVLTSAITHLESSLLTDEHTPFRQVVFAAPDIDREDFQRFAQATVHKPQHFTLYACSHDLALLLSKTFNGHERAGDSQPLPFLFADLDSIDASDVDTSLLGHSYYADPWVINDLYFLLNQNKKPCDRFGLREVKAKEGTYWSVAQQMPSSPQSQHDAPEIETKPPAAAATVQ